MLEVLSHSDPIGLFRLGCPPDEYVPEAGPIFEALAEVESLNDLHDLMYRVFEKKFNYGFGGPKSRYQEPARVFWADWRWST